MTHRLYGAVPPILGYHTKAAQQIPAHAKLKSQRPPTHLSLLAAVVSFAKSSTGSRLSGMAAEPSE